MKICKMALVDLINRFTGSRKHKPFERIKNVPPEKLVLFLQQEHPQTITCVLAHLKPRKAAAIIKQLPNETQSEVTQRIATLDRVSPDILYEVEKVLEQELSAMSDDDYTAPSGLENIVPILKSVGKTISNQILKSLEKDDPELAEEIKKRRKC